MQNLLNTITRCSNIEICINSNNSNHPCSSVVLTQGLTVLDKFKVPEPWSGRIETAPILFIGDSATTDAEEEYPTLEWNNYLVKDFFNHRFGGGIKNWVKDGLYSLCGDGEYKKQWNRLWSSCANRTLELLETISINPGYDFAVSETSRCRSFASVNRDKAIEECCSRYLKQVIDKSGATVIVGMGDDAKKHICRAYNINTDDSTSGPQQVGCKERYFAFLPHYNSKGPRSFGEAVKRDERHALIAYLKNNN